MVRCTRTYCPFLSCPCPFIIKCRSLHTHTHRWTLTSPAAGHHPDVDTEHGAQKAQTLTLPRHWTGPQHTPGGHTVNSSSYYIYIVRLNIASAQVHHFSPHHPVRISCARQKAKHSFVSGHHFSLEPNVSGQETRQQGFKKTNIDKIVLWWRSISWKK